MVKKIEKIISIKTVKVEGEIFAYGMSSVLHRKLTCYTGSKGVLYYADNRLPCTKGTMGIIWKAFKQLPNFAYTEKVVEMPLKDVLAAFDRIIIKDTKLIEDSRQKSMANLYNKEIKAVMSELKKIA